MMSTQFCHLQVLDHMALQPRRLLAAYGASMNSENEREADSGQRSNIDSTRKTIFTRLRFSSVVSRMYTLLSLVPHESSVFPLLSYRLTLPH